MAKQRKVPLRKCVVTGEQQPKKDLVRIVKNKEGEIAIDPTGKLNGRGAYVSLHPEVVKEAMNNKALDKSLGITISEEFYQELYDYVDHQYARKQL